MGENPAKKAAKTKEERIEALKKRKQELEARLHALVNSKTKEERQLDVKKAILIGQCVKKRIELGYLSQADMNGWLNDFLTRPYERELFGLGEKK